MLQSGATCIIHTASPPHGLDPAIYWKVNVEGTKAVIAAAVAHHVKKLVFTSSAGVIFNGQDVIDVDERLPFPETPLDAYNESKSKAEELVLEANGKGGLKTVALRPAGIFGYVTDYFLSFYLVLLFVAREIGRSCMVSCKYSTTSRLTSKLAITRICLTGHMLRM